MINMLYLDCDTNDNDLVVIQSGTVACPNFICLSVFFVFQTFIAHISVTMDRILMKLG